MYCLLVTTLLYTLHTIAPPLPKTRINIVQAARECEVATLERLGLLDMWSHVHFDHLAMSMPRGYTWPACSDDTNPAKTAALLHILDRIHVPRYMADNVSGVFTTYLGKSNHKAVVMKVYPLFLTPALHVGLVRRPSCRVSLQYRSCSMNSKRSAPSHGIFPSPSHADRIINRCSFAENQPTNRYIPVLAFLLHATPQHVPTQVWKHLFAQRVQLRTHNYAYSMLVSLFEQQSQDKVGLEQLSIQRGIIADEQVSQFPTGTGKNKLIAQWSIYKRRKKWPGFVTIKGVCWRIRSKWPLRCVTTGRASHRKTPPSLGISVRKVYSFCASLRIYAN